MVPDNFKAVGTAKCANCGTTRGITDDAAGLADLNREGWRATTRELFCPLCAPLDARPLVAKTGAN
jgi:hypothetical protein